MHGQQNIKKYMYFFTIRQGMKYRKIWLFSTTDVGISKGGMLIRLLIYSKSRD